MGAKRKGFDVAVVDDRRLLALEGGLSRRAVIQVIEDAAPAVVAIDSPRSCAPDGERTREDERRLNREICGIRWTPAAEQVRASAYYAWIVEGLGLFEALAIRQVEAIEVFPTAAWTRWFGKRGSRTRSRWSSDGLSALSLEGTPTRSNQDQRDAIAAALIARLHTRGRTEMIGEIIVPAATGCDDLVNAPLAAP